MINILMKQISCPWVLSQIKLLETGGTRVPEWHPVRLTYNVGGWDLTAEIGLDISNEASRSARRGSMLHLPALVNLLLSVICRYV